MADSRLNATCELGSTTTENRRRPIELPLAAAGGSCSLCTVYVQSADMKSLSPYMHKASVAIALLYSTSGRNYLHLTPRCLG